jgi:hypothetical protein
MEPIRNNLQEQLGKSRPVRESDFTCFSAYSQKRAEDDAECERR